LVVANIISQYKSAARQRVCFEKHSIVLRKKVEWDSREQILHASGMVEGDQHEKRLGLPTTIGKSKKTVFSYPKERI